MPITERDLRMAYGKRPKARSAFRISTDKPKRVVQALAVDEFGELAARKKTAAKWAQARGHQMTGWCRRKNDVAGRWNAYCADCNMAAVVCTEAPTGMPDIYGPAVDKECEGRT